MLAEPLAEPVMRKVAPGTGLRHPIHSAIAALSVGNQVVDDMVADTSGHDLAASFWTAARNRSADSAPSSSPSAICGRCFIK